MSTDITPQEKLNIKLCKQSLKIPRRASNLGCRAELGIIPINKSVIVAILKYFRRSQMLEETNFLFQSQHKLTTNCYSTYTYTKFCNHIVKELGIDNSVWSKNE
jgi:hypothetical protein